jgi:acetyl esterase/lipase
VIDQIDMSMPLGPAMKITIVVLVLFAPLSGAFAQNPSGIKFTRNIIIARIGGSDITLDTAVREGASAGPASPAVLMIHGGNWSKGNAHGSFLPLVPSPGLCYAENGYFVASVGYRLSGVAKWPAQIQDCKLAIRYLRAHAKELNLIPDRIAVCGFSAGAHLAGCVGVMQDVPEMEGDGGYPTVSSRVQAVVLVSAPVDMTVFFTDRDGPVKGGAENTELFGDGWRDQPELLRRASLTFYVKPGLPPFWLGTSDRDHAVSFKQVNRLADALKGAHVPMEYLFVKNAVHGLIAPPDAKARGRPDPVPSPVDSTAMTLRFLDRYLKR